MHYNDHPPAHFHATYGGEEIRVTVDTLEILSGSLARRAQAMVLEWAVLHQDDLAACREQARAHQPLGTIDLLAKQEDAMRTTTARLRGARAGSARTIELSFPMDPRAGSTSNLCCGARSSPRSAGNDDAFAELFSTRNWALCAGPTGPTSHRRPCSAFQTSDATDQL